MNKLAIILLIVVIGYVSYTAYPSLTGNIVSKPIDSEKEDVVESDATTPNSNLADSSEPKKNLESQLQLTNVPENKINKTKDLCENIFCEDSVSTCSDGFVSSCKNTCTEGSCSVCKPNCIGHEIIEKQNQTCTENWSCSNWSECFNGEETRTCADQNNCGSTLKKPDVSQSCSIDQKQLAVILLTDNQTIVRGNDVQISVKVAYNSNPVENANVFLNLTYASGTVVQNSSTTNSTGDYSWVKRISGNAKVGTFKIRVEAEKEGYLNAFAEAGFEVVAKS